MLSTVYAEHCLCWMPSIFVNWGCSCLELFTLNVAFLLCWVLFMLSIVCAECFYAERCSFWMLCFVMLSVVVYVECCVFVMLRVIRLNVIRLSVLAPLLHPPFWEKEKELDGIMKDNWALKVFEFSYWVWGTKNGATTFSIMTLATMTIA